MARKSDDLVDSFATDESGGWLTRLLADEEELDQRGKWQLGAWAVGSVGALIIAVLASHNAVDRQREQAAAGDLTRQSQMIQRLAKDSQSEASRLAAAIETLNGDRDRLFSRLGALEQGLDSVTGSIAWVQTASSAPPAPMEKSADKAVSPAALPEIPPKQTGAPTAPAIASVEARPTSPPAARGKPAPAAESSAPAAPPPLAATATVTASAEAAPPQVAKPVQAPPTLPPPVALAPAPAAAPEAEPAKHASERPPADSPPLERPGKAAPADKPLAALITTTPLMPPRSILAPPDPGATKLAPTQEAEDEVEKAEEAPTPVQRTEFGVDLGGANTLDGLRAIWRKLSQTQKAALKGLQPIVMVKERSGGTQLRLVAGPLNDAAAAARLCAAISSSERACETSVFDGQRLPAAMAAPAAPVRRHRTRSPAPSEPAPPPPPSPQASEPAASTSGAASLTSMFGIR